MSLLFDKSGKFFLPIGCEARSIAYREVPNNRDNATSAVIYKMLQNFATLNRYTKKTSNTFDVRCLLYAYSSDIGSS